MTRRGPLLIALGLLVAAAVALSAWRVTGIANDAMAGQVRASEELAATERAAAISQALTGATERLDELAARAGTLDRLPADARLSIALATLVSQPGTMGATVVAADGTVLAGSGTMPDLAAGRSPAFVPADERGDAAVILRAPVQMPGIEGIAGYVVQQLSLRALAPGFTQPFAAFEGATSLVTRDGAVLMSTVDSPSARVQNPDVLRVVQRGEPAFLKYHSSHFGSDRVGVTRPVPATDLVVIVSADASSVGAPASALVEQILFVLTATVAVAGALVAVMMLITRRSRRRLAHAASLALLDPLTGMTNRRGLDERVASLGPAAVVAVDVDGLKLINDTTGHAAGDRAIVLVAQALRNAVRADDVVARVGGDEFVVVMPGATAERAERAVRSIMEALADDDLRVSTGIAMAPPGAFADALARADAELYVRKRERREVAFA